MNVNIYILLFHILFTSLHKQIAKCYDVLYGFLQFGFVISDISIWVKIHENVTKIRNTMLRLYRYLLEVVAEGFWASWACWWWCSWSSEYLLDRGDSRVAAAFDLKQNNNVNIRVNLSIDVKTYFTVKY